MGVPLENFVSWFWWRIHPNEAYKLAQFEDQAAHRLRLEQHFTGILRGKDAPRSPWRRSLQSLSGLYKRW